MSREIKDMEFITGALVAVIAVIWGLYYFSPKNRKLRQIPGPSGYPLVGNALQMEPTRPHETLREWAKQYGDVMKINFFGDDMVVVNSYEGLTDVMLKKSNDFAGRPYSYRSTILFDDNDLVMADMTPKWSYMKKASMTGLKIVGDQVTELEDILQRFLDDLINTYKNWKGKTVDVYEVLNEFVHHVQFTLVYGRELTSAEHKKSMKVIDGILESFNPISEYASLETLPFLRGFWFGTYRKFRRIVKESRDLFMKHASITVEDHDDEIKCLLDGMVQEMKHPSNDKIAHLTFGNIYSAGLNLIAAGVQTTSSALYYFISLMATNPKIQDEAHDHVIKAIDYRKPSLTDRFAIPYVESMMLEILRLMSHLPVSVPHMTRTDTTLHGYDIPKGTQIWPNLWFLHHDERLWEDPWEFKPKRFLDKNGDFVNADHPLRKQFYAFGAGRRVCIGESLAKHRMFLFITTMLQNFRFVEPEGEKIVTDPRELQLGFVLLPSPYKVHIELRQ